MPVTDPVADMLTRVRNALAAKKEVVEMPASKMKASIAQILLAEGFIKGWDIKEDNAQGMLKLKLKYAPDGGTVIAGLRRISKPGLRVYAKADQIPKVLGGLGIAIISTSQGVVTDSVARTNGVGGEVLAYIW